MEQERIADSDSDKEEARPPTSTEKARGRQPAKKGGRGPARSSTEPAKPRDGDVDDVEGQKAKSVPGAEKNGAKIAKAAPTPDNSSVESISEILKAAPRVR
jgi:hypothetical protein